jgi:hypothetical protein
LIYKEQEKLPTETVDNSVYYMSNTVSIPGINRS